MLRPYVAREKECKCSPLVVSKRVPVLGTTTESLRVRKTSMATTLGQIPDDEAWHRTIILPRDILDNPPSGEHEVEWEEESSHRIWGCELLQEAGILLRLPQVVMCTAQNLLQRFYYRKSLTEFDTFSVAMACMLLAMKIEENPGKPQAVVLVFHRMFERRTGVEPSGVIPPESFKVLQNEMLRTELHVLKELGFGFYNIMDHPHTFILYYLRMLELDVEGDVWQRAWNYINDSLRTDLSLRFRSEVIACAAIYMASRSLGIKLPDNPPWWVLFNADMREMGEICNSILALYHRPKVSFLEPLCEKSIFRRGGPLRKSAGVEDTREVYTPADGEVESAGPASLSEEHPIVVDERHATHASVEPPIAAAREKGNVSGGAAESPGLPVPSVAGQGDMRAGESTQEGVTSIDKGREGGSEDRSGSQSRSRSRSKSHRSHSTSGSAPGLERDECADREGNGRLSERAQDRERDRKRPRENKRSRSRSRERSSRRSDDSRERDVDRERARDRDRDRGRPRDWGRSKDRERDRRHDRVESRRSRR